MLNVQGVNVFYDDAQALWDINLDVTQNEIVTIVGSNGAGKSTLVKAIAGLVPVRKGSIRFDGLDLTKLPAYKICACGIALVPEGRRVFPKMTVRENLEMGAYVTKARAQLARSMEYVFELFPRLKERLHQLAGTLSGGEQQMLAIGRALMARPKLLLLDEPSLGLAPAVVDQIFSILRQLNQHGIAMLLVEQNVARALAISHRAFILEEGRIVRSDTPSNLMADEAIRRAYLGHS